jgi:tetratricopeptide (TPR) repeat protein/predicted Ser/Thr protein kinase
MRYETAVPLGSGGVGEVFKAYDPALQRFVALKYLKHHDPALAERLLREARLQARVDHEAVCKVYAAGTDETGRPYIAMQYIEGRTLERAAAELSLAEKLRVVQRVAEAVHAAHETGLIHRDLKPENIMLDERSGEEPKAYVLDFGLAREHQATGLTRTGVIVGTVAYMAPEQARGEVHTLDRRTDVYALGATLYRVLAGRPPFQGSDLDVILQSLHRDPTPLREIDGAIPRDVETIVGKCLEKDPQHRYATAQSLALDLAHVLAAEPIDARPPSRVRSLLRPVRRNPSLSVALAAALVSFAALALVLARRREPAELPFTRVAQPRRSFAVLRLKNSSGRAEAAWVGTALAEMLTTELAAGGRLRAIPGENVARARSELGLPDSDALAQDTLRRVQANLGADLVVLGSYLAGPNAAGDVRLDLRLQDAASGATVALAAETGREAHLSELVTRVAGRMRVALGLPALDASQQATLQSALWSQPQAARLYAEGLEALRADDARAARDHLAAAAALEPRSALVHSALAAAWWDLGYEERGRSEARQAFELSPGLDREQRLLIEARYRETAREWERALEIERTLFIFFTDDAEYGLRLARTQIAASRAPEALKTIDTLKGLPLSPGIALRVDLLEAEAADAVGDRRRQQAAAVRAKQNSRGLGRGRSLVRSLLAEVSALRHAGRPDAALADCAEAERMARADGDAEQAAQALMARSGIVWESGDARTALPLIEEAGALYAGIGHQKGVALAANNACNMLDALGRRTEARQQCEQALAILREIDDKRGIANTLNNLGAILWAQDDAPGSLKAYETAITILRGVGDAGRWAVAAGNLADGLVQVGDLPRARQLFEEALATDRRLGDRRSIAYRLEGLAQVMLISGDVPRARQLAQQSLAIFEALGEKAALALTELLLGMVAIEEGHLAEAEALARRGASGFHQVGDSEHEAQALAQLARTLLAAGHREEAALAARRAHAAVPASPPRELRFDDVLTAARIGAASGQAAAARRRAAAVAAEAETLGLVSFALDARLAEAEIALLGGDADAETLLGALERDAAAKGFVLISRKARAQRKSSSALYSAPGPVCALGVVT